MFFHEKGEMRTVIVLLCVLIGVSICTVIGVLIALSVLRDISCEFCRQRLSLTRIERHLITKRQVTVSPLSGKTKAVRHGKKRGGAFATEYTYECIFECNHCKCRSCRIEKETILE